MVNVTVSVWHYLKAKDDMLEQCMMNNFMQPNWLVAYKMPNNRQGTQFIAPFHVFCYSVKQMLESQII